MLVLADADRLRIDLDQFGQRILQAARDRHRAAQRHVQVGQFARGEFGRRIHRGAGFRHDDLGQLQFGLLLDQVLRQLVGLARGGAVADRDQRHIVLGRQLAQRVQRAIPVVARLVRVDRGGVDHLAGGVDHRHLHAGAQARVEAHRGARAGRRGQQQGLQVAREHVDRLELGLFAQGAHQFGFEVHEAFHAPGPARRVEQPLVGRAALRPRCRSARRCGLRTDCAARPTSAFPASVSRRSATSSMPSRRPRSSASARCDGTVASGFASSRSSRRTFRLRPACRRRPSIRRRRAPARTRAASAAASASSAKRSIRIWRAPSSAALASGTPGLLPPSAGEGVAQVVWRLRPRDPACGSASRASASGARPASIAIWALVRRFCLYGRYRSSSRVLSSASAIDVQQRRRHLVLLRDRGDDRGAPVFQLAQVAQALFEQAQLDVVQAAGGFLAVARDERHGGAFVEQGDGGGHLRRPGGEFVGEALFDGWQHRQW